METDEKIYDLIKKVYLKYLNRAPDKIGLEYFFHQIKDGIILPHDLKETIKQSKEYQDKIKEQELSENISLESDNFLNENSYEILNDFENEPQIFVSCYNGKNNFGGIYYLSSKKLEPVFDGVGCFGMHFDKIRKILFFITRKEPQIIAYKITNNKFSRMEISFSNYIFAEQVHGITIFKDKIYVVATNGIKNDPEKAINSEFPNIGIGKIIVSDLDFFDDKIIVKNSQHYNPFSCNHHHHINDLCIHDNVMYLLSHSYCDKNKIYIKKGALSKLDSKTLQANILLDKFQQPHSLHSYKDRIFLCSGSIAAVLSIFLPNKIKLEYKGIDVYARGLIVTKNHIFLGNSFGIGRTNSKFKTPLCGVLKFDRKNGAGNFYVLPSGCDNVYSIINAT